MPYRSISLIAAAMLSLPAAAAPVFDNPLVQQRADPHVTLQPDGYYYLAATVPEYDRIEIRRARDLNALGKGESKVIWHKHARARWPPTSGHRKCTASTASGTCISPPGAATRPWRSGLYVLENDSANPLEGTWTERGQLKTGWESFALDATTFALDGRRYLLWTQRPPTADKHMTAVYIAEMASPLSIKGKVTLLTTPEYPWEKVKFDVNEAPAVLVKNGRVFVTYSASATDANYALGMVTADAGANLLDARSWSKSPHPVFASSKATGQYGPGHNSFTTTPDGKTDILVYHARGYEHIPGDSLHDPNRHTRAQAVAWRADGTPDFGEPVADKAPAAAQR